MAAARPQRKLAAIFAADVVGYSRLIRADEEGTLERLSRLRQDLTDPGIAKYDGRIVKPTGDGIQGDGVNVAARQMVSQEPRFTPAFAKQKLFYLKIPAQLELYLEGLKQAGVPEK